ncbi:hypothetical protein FGO68_gene152 [Halteria grandinella]|uniref:Uncharacterized protein n=1 Tax=Halteria grandinella TaxID=5974 RepID=A0A8J8NWR2_HALGN|nr:hypothetical protein FGO68_gene152 [Halteria grandinella]
MTLMQLCNYGIYESGMFLTISQQSRLKVRDQSYEHQEIDSTSVADWPFVKPVNSNLLKLALEDSITSWSISKAMVQLVVWINYLP